jgi:purine-binding chemotaxis protein CheW
VSTDTQLSDPSQDQLLTFVVANEEYGVDILRVQEIRTWSAPMPLPRAPEFVKGVINIRGDIIPIADLRERIGLPILAPGGTTAIVVLRVEDGHKSRVIGIVVDAMSDVIAVSASAMRPPPDVGRAADATSLIRGIALVDAKMVTILEVDHILPPAPAASNSHVSQGAA